MQTEEKPFKIGLALGGGAMRGLAHIGAMQVMEEHGIMPDVVAGTSIGAFVGGVYACGMSLKMMERFCYSINEKDLMDVVRPRQGLIGGARIERMLRTLTGNRTFDQARIPFAAVATELERGERFVFQEGPIWEGVRASISIPGIFVPFHTGGHTYVDGGVVDRVPIAAARELGADFVIGVDVGYRGGEKLVIAKPLTYMNESGNALASISAYYQIEPDHIVVIHDDMDLDFGRIKVKAGGSAGGHNGIKSIDRSLGTPKYARVRMGVGHSKRGANAHDNTVNWVLGGFGPDQRKQLPEFLADGADAAEDIIFHGLAKTQEKFNGR